MMKRLICTQKLWIQWSIDDSGERTPTEYGGRKGKGPKNKEDDSLMYTWMEDYGELKND